MEGWLPSAISQGGHKEEIEKGGGNQFLGGLNQQKQIGSYISVPMHSLV